MSAAAAAPASTAAAADAKSAKQTDTKSTTTTAAAAPASEYSAGAWSVQVIGTSMPLNAMYLPHVRQSTGYTCGVGAMQSLFMYFGDEYREDRLAKILKSGDVHGTDCKQIIRFANELGYNTALHFQMTLTELQREIDAGHPVLIVYQAWAGTDERPDWIKHWSDGHYSVVIGYDANHIYLMDPSWLGHYSAIPIPEFLTRWHDTDGNIPEGWNPATAKETDSVKFKLMTRTSYASPTAAAAAWADMAKASNAENGDKPPAASLTATSATALTTDAGIPEVATIYMQTGIAIWKNGGAKYAHNLVQFTA